MEMSVPTQVKSAVHAPGREVAALVVTPHPLSQHGQRVYPAREAALLPGETLAAFLGRHGVMPGQQWVVTIGGVAVHEMHWGRVRPRPGHLIECRRAAEKSVLQLAAVVALSYFTFGAGGASVFGTTLTGKLAAGIAYMAGSAVIAKLFAPKPLTAPEITTNPTYSLSAGGRNQNRQWQPVGLVLGEPYMVPDLAAQPYTYFKSGEQYLWQAFHCGINCADVHSLRIGQTALDSYTGVTVLRNGMASGNSDFPALGTSVDSVAGAALEAPSGNGLWVERTSSVDTVRLSVDLVATLYEVADDGAYKRRTLDIGAEYRAVGSSTWLPFNDQPLNDAPLGILRLISSSTKPVRHTAGRDVPAGQYEVRLSKITQDYTGTRGSNQVEWSNFKSYQRDTGDYDGQSRLAIDIQASGQLSGALDELNAQAVAKPMPYWDGSAWTTATARGNGLCNPGAILLMLARGIYNSSGRLIAGLGFSDDRIDIEGLKRFMVHCAEQGFEFDYFLQDTTSVGDLMAAVAAAGMGQIDWPDGKLGVVFYAEDDPVEGVINMATVKAKSFSVEYQTLPTAEEIELRYLSREQDNSWTSVRAVVPGISTPSSTAPTQMVGVSTEAHAARLLRFLMAQNIYQRKTITLEMDLEYMTYRRGQVVALSHDLTQWGYGGRLLACEDIAGTIRLTLDDTAPGSIPSGYSGRYIGLRLPGERQMRAFPVKPFAGDARVIELDAAWPAGVSLPGSSADNPARDTLWLYDFKATPGQLLRVASITPSLDGARLTLVPEVAEFWPYVTSGAYTPPPNNSLLQGTPTVHGVTVTEELSVQGTTFFTELSIDYDVAGSFARAELWGSTGGFEGMARLGESRSQRISWRGALDETWALELRVYSDTRAADPYRLTYTVLGLRQPPPPFDVFSVLAQPDGTRQFNFGYTSTVVPVDWLGAEIRYLTGTHTAPSWDNMVPLQDASTYYTASPVEVNQLLSGAHTFAARSLDTTGNLSTPVYFQINLPPRRLGNVVAEYDEAAESWAGTLASATLNTQNNTVEAASATTWDALTTWDAWTRWTLTAATPLTYTGPVRDFGAVLTALVDVTNTAAGEISIEARSSQTSADPVSDPGAWTVWGAADLKFTARYLQVRATVSANAGNPVAVLSALAYVVSAPLINEYLNDQDISTYTGGNRIGVGDVRIPLANSYGTLLEINCVIQDASVGSWAWVLIDKTLTGPRVQFRLNGTLADPDLTDFIIKGF